MDKLNIPHIFDDERWQACLTDYLCHHIYDEKSRSEKTYDNYSRYLKQFFSGSANGGPAKMPENYNRRDVEDFLRRPCGGFQHPGAEPSPGTKRLRLTVLKSFFKYASEYTVEGEDGKPQRLFQAMPPTTGINYVKRINNYKAMSIAEVQAFFSAIPLNTLKGIRDYCIYTFYLYTLRRLSEVARLKFGDLFRGIIRDEHGNTHEGWLYQWTGKGMAGQMEMIELSKPCIATLMRWLEASGRLNTIQPDDPLFVPLSSYSERHSAKAYLDTHAHLSTQHLSTSTIARNFKYICACAGLDDAKFSVHSFRHTGIQMRIMTGQEITDIMKVSSHKSLDSFMLYARRLNTADTGASAFEQYLNLPPK